MISDAWMQELMSKSDIASVIGEYTTLTPKSGKLWACCPFHNEKTPSFKVDTTTQLYYCFGCHKGGNVITFIKEKENMSGFEAIKYLADRVGMAMPDSGYDKEAAELARKSQQRMYNANRDAARFYFSHLKESDKAVQYLKNRGLNESVITRFGIGYAPDSWTALYDHLKKLGYSDEEVTGAGLARRSEKGRIFDFFRNRVVFPIIDDKGNVLAFGGRTMGDDTPKYLNTGDTPVYNKRNNVYALNMLGKGTYNDIIIVEGYMDVISLHANGVNNAVATLGTALTQNQAQLLKRRTNKIYVSYDGDSAGQNATLRGLDILAQAGLEVRVIVLPDGLDPDDYARKYGKEGYMRLKDESLALNDFKIEHMSKRYNMESVDERQKFAIEACGLISHMQPVEQERYYEKVSRKTGISYETLRAQGGKEGTKPEKRNNISTIRNNREKAAGFATSESDRLELMLVACAAQSREAASYIAKNGLEYLIRKEAAQFILGVRGAFESTGECNVSMLINDIEGDVSAISAALSEMHIEAPYKTAEDCIKRLRRERLNNELRELSRKLDAHEIGITEYKAVYEHIHEQLNRLRNDV